MQLESVYRLRYPTMSDTHLDGVLLVGHDGVLHVAIGRVVLGVDPAPQVSAVLPTMVLSKMATESGLLPRLEPVECDTSTGGGAAVPDHRKLLIRNEPPLFPSTKTPSPKPSDWSPTTNERSTLIEFESRIGVAVIPPPVATLVLPSSETSPQRATHLGSPPDGQHQPNHRLHQSGHLAARGSDPLWAAAAASTALRTCRCGAGWPTARFSARPSAKTKSSGGKGSGPSWPDLGALEI